MEVLLSIVGLAIIVVVVATAIRLLRRPRYRYPGDREPQPRRSGHALALSSPVGKLSCLSHESG